jgi:hypothetical protein
MCRINVADLVMFAVSGRDTGMVSPRLGVGRISWGLPEDVDPTRKILTEGQDEMLHAGLDGAGRGLEVRVVAGRRRGPWGQVPLCDWGWRLLNFVLDVLQDFGQSDRSGFVIRLPRAG